MNMGGSRRQASPSRLMKPDGRWNESGSGGLARTLDRLFSTVLFPPFSSNQLKPDGRWDESGSGGQARTLDRVFQVSPRCLPETERMCLLSNVPSNHMKPEVRWDESGLIPTQTEDPSPTLEDTWADRHLFPVFKKTIGEKEDKRKQPTTTPNGRCSIDRADFFNWRIFGLKLHIWTISWLQPSGSGSPTSPALWFGHLLQVYTIN